MKAAVVVANEDVQYQEIEEPQAKPGWPLEPFINCNAKMTNFAFLIRK